MNILIGTEAFTIATGIMSVELNGGSFTAVALEDSEEIKVGLVTHKKTVLSPLGEAYLDCLAEVGQRVRILTNN